MVINRPWTRVYTFAAVLLCATGPAEAATIHVANGGDLQQALNAAQPGDTILLAENAEFVGNFVLPVKTGRQWITRPHRGSRQRPAARRRAHPAGARAAAGAAAVAERLRRAAHRRRRASLGHPLSRFRRQENGAGDIIQLGDGSAAQNTLGRVPHHIVLSHLYVHGDPLHGQKRGIALNAAARHHRRLVHRGVQRRRAGHPGDRRLERTGALRDREQLPRSRRRERDVRWRRSGDSQPGRRRHHVPPQLPVASDGVAQSDHPDAAGALRERERRADRCRPASTATGSWRAGRSGKPRTGRSTASAEVTVTTSAPGRGARALAGGGGRDRVPRVRADRRAPTPSTGASPAPNSSIPARRAPARRSPRPAGTVWSVKNIFELKNARNVVVENNIFENHWKESQPGYAIVLTPRNSNGACTWCVVEHVRSRAQHRARTSPPGSICSATTCRRVRPASRPTSPFRQNLFTGLTTTLGGNALVPADRRRTARRR